MNKEILSEFLVNDFGITVSEKQSFEEMRKQLAAFIDELVNHNFNKLVSLLYRIDVNENKLKQMLKANRGNNAAQMIADLIIERQRQKIAQKEKPGSKKTEPGLNSFDDERW